ncbi:archaeal proteasome endopeptidase complex subunit beta [Natrononativus amylolyticus]|uniref:archaeal proteasome endopeptidase complex subunit beta n=1 Tax=Natrononativus amylolyticus TaxID=2963434 RepID=UPI0020CCA013|nr:archaeal proteasome endopeptidase complex subunit beta [Natrononativus amylolyticus]
MRTPMHDSDFSRTSQRLADDTSPYDPELGALPRNEFSSADLDNVNKTGTTTIGLTTGEGVVIATDMRASLGGRFVSNKNVQKVEQIHPTGALTMVGSVGGAQSFIKSLRAEVNLYEARQGASMSIDALATLAGNFARGGPFFAIHPILGGVDHEGSHVYSIDPAGGVMGDDYTVTGSGMQLAYGLLEQEYEEGLSNEEAMVIAARGIKSAAERDTGSGNGVFLCEITDEGVDIHGHNEFEEVI